MQSLSLRTFLALCAGWVCKLGAYHAMREAIIHVGGHMARQSLGALFDLAWQADIKHLPEGVRGHTSKAIALCMQARPRRMEVVKSTNFCVPKRQN